MCDDDARDRAVLERAAKAAWVAYNGDDDWARSVVDDVFSPADDWPEEALAMERVARAATGEHWEAIDPHGLWQEAREPQLIGVIAAAIEADRAQRKGANSARAASET